MASIAQLPRNHHRHGVFQIGRGMAERPCQLFAGQYRNLITQAARRHIEQLIAHWPGGMGFFNVDQKSNIGGDTARHARRHHIIMAFEKGIGHDSLKQDDRRDDDD